MFLKSPTEVFWSVTNQCNLNCNFCLADSCQKISTKELSSEQKSYVLNELIKNKVLKVYITGGEPLTCPDILDYIKVLRDNNVFIELTTNATLLTKSIISRLKEYKTNRIQVSINGSNPEINDAIMGRSFNSIWKNLELLVEAGLSTHVKVTAIEQNFDDIPVLVTQLAGIGVEHVDISEVHPLGRAQKTWSSIKLENDQLVQLKESLDDIYETTNMSLSFHSPTMLLHEDGLPASCSVGLPNSHSCQIMYNGQVIPCAFGSVWRIRNNILDGGLQKSWQGLKKFRRYLKPELLQGQCADCEFQYQCGGGCRAIAYLFSGKIWGEYPFCPKINKKELKNGCQREMAKAFI